jgi:hypothetical protein
MEIAATGYGGLVLILWLMVMKPFYPTPRVRPPADISSPAPIVCI